MKEENRHTKKDEKRIQNAHLPSLMSGAPGLQCSQKSQTQREMEKARQEKGPYKATGRSGAAGRKIERGSRANT